MPRRHRFPQLRGRPSLVVLAAIVGLLALPVEYRGGASSPHAHAAYQLWYDAAHGSVAHHHVGGDRPRDLAGLDAARRHPAWAIAVDAAEDVPRVVALSIGASKIPLLAVAVRVVAIPSHRRPVWPVPGALRGRRLAPEPPPPRSRLRFA